MSSWMAPHKRMAKPEHDLACLTIRVQDLEGWAQGVDDTLERLDPDIKEDE